MKKSFVLTPLARRDLEEVWDYLAADSRGTALDPLEQTMARLARVPSLSHLREASPAAGTAFFWSIPISSFIGPPPSPSK